MHGYIPQGYIHDNPCVARGCKPVDVQSINSDTQSSTKKNASERHNWFAARPTINDGSGGESLLCARHGARPSGGAPTRHAGPVRAALPPAGRRTQETRQTNSYRETALRQSCTTAPVPPLHHHRCPCRCQPDEASRLTHSGRSTPQQTRLSGSRTGGECDSDLPAPTTPALSGTTASSRMTGRGRARHAPIKVVPCF